MNLIDLAKKTGFSALARTMESDPTIKKAAEDLKDQLQEGANLVRPVLIIACGADKITDKGELAARDLYGKGFWAVYRKNSPAIKHPFLDVYVMSAEYGIIPETTLIEPYERLLVDDRKFDNSKKRESYWKPVRDLLPLLKEQIASLDLQDHPVWFSGNKTYLQALQKAGLNVIPLYFHRAPGLTKGHGDGIHRGALRHYLSYFEDGHPAWLQNLRSGSELLTPYWETRSIPESLQGIDRDKLTAKTIRGAERLQRYKIRGHGVKIPATHIQAKEYAKTKGRIHDHTSKQEDSWREGQLDAPRAIYEKASDTWWFFSLKNLNKAKDILDPSRITKRKEEEAKREAELRRSYEIRQDQKFADYLKLRKMLGLGVKKTPKTKELCAIIAQPGCWSDFPMTITPPEKPTKTQKLFMEAVTNLSELRFNKEFSPETQLVLNAPRLQGKALLEWIIELVVECKLPVSVYSNACFWIEIRNRRKTTPGWLKQFGHLGEIEEGKKGYVAPEQSPVGKIKRGDRIKAKRKKPAPIFYESTTEAALHLWMLIDENFKQISGDYSTIHDALAAERGSAYNQLMQYFADDYSVVHPMDLAGMTPSEWLDEGGEEEFLDNLGLIYGTGSGRISNLIQQMGFNLYGAKGGVEILPSWSVAEIHKEMKEGIIPSRYPVSELQLFNEALNVYSCIMSGWPTPYAVEF